MGNITWTKSWSASDNGTVFGGADLQNIQGDITTVVNGGITNSNVNASAAIAESKIAFSTTGHSHNGTDSAGIGGGPSNILWGLEIAQTTDDDTTVTIKPGYGFHGTTGVDKTANTTLTFAVADDWYDGATHSYSGAAGWCYIGYNQDSEIKLLGANPQDCHDVSGTAVAGATDLYFDDSGGTSTEYWRVLGAVRVDTDNKIHASYQQHQVGNKVYTANALAVLTAGQSATFADVNCSTMVPRGARSIDGYLNPNDSTASTFYWRAKGDPATGGIKFQFGGFGGDIEIYNCALDEDQFGQYKIVSDVNGSTLKLTAYRLDIR